MTFVLDKLFVGGIDEASKPWKLQKQGISHILTLDVKPLPIENRQGFEYKYVHALDMESFDLLDRLPACIEFINRAREEGGVLVHCHAGQSRSATVVLAYMMQKMVLSLGEALTLLQKLRPCIRPNSGFLSQLELFECMGNQVDPQNQQYKLYKLSRMATEIQSGHHKAALQKDSMAADPSLGLNADEKYYRCKKCRRGLFKQCAVLTHTEGYGEAAFDWRVTQCRGDREHASMCQRSLFIEPVQWMEEDILQTEGKLSCPKCNAKIGSFTWTGEKCPCGSWVTPAFHIQANKVDQAIQRNISQPSRLTVGRPVVKPSQTFHIAGIDREKTSENQSDKRQQDTAANQDSCETETVGKQSQITNVKQTIIVKGESCDHSQNEDSSLNFVSQIGDAVGIQDIKELPPL